MLKAAILKVGPRCKVLMMRNHVAITIGRTVGEASVLYYFLDRVCRTQLQVMQTGPNQIHLPAEATLRASSELAWSEEVVRPGVEWQAVKTSFLKHG